MGAKKLAAVVFLAAFFAGSFGIALAEGARYSSMDEVYSGFNFRDFYDSNADATSTWSTLGGCYLNNSSYSPFPIQLNLWRVNDWAPDDNLGAGVYTSQSITRYWGDKSAATYHFTLTWYNRADYWDPLSCGTVNYGW